MKKIQIASLTASLAIVTGSYAAVTVDGTPANPDIVVSADGSDIYGYINSADAEPKSFTMTTGGAVQVTNVGSGSAYGVATDSSKPGAAVNISGGTMTVSESDSGNAELFQSSQDSDVWTISGGTFTATESGAGALYGFYSSRDTQLNISGGTWNFTQDDSSVGALFATENHFRSGATINLSGGQFNNLDQFDTHILLGDPGATFNLSTFEYVDTGLTITAGAIQDLTGTITFKFTELGDDFSFNFNQAAAGQIKLTGVAIPEPGTYALLAGLTGLSFVMLRRRRA